MRAITGVRNDLISPVTSQNDNGILSFIRLFKKPSFTIASDFSAIVIDLPPSMAVSLFQHGTPLRIVEYFLGQISY